MSDEKLSESTTRLRYIDPQLKESGWNTGKITIVQEAKNTHNNDHIFIITKHM